MKTIVFDLYGTLVDIHTDEENPDVWQKLALFFCGEGADYTGKELEKAYMEEVAKETAGMKRLRKDSHEGNPEIDIDKVFSALYKNKGINADKRLVEYTARFFRILTTEYIKLYPGAMELLETLNSKGVHTVLLSNAQALFTIQELKALHLLDHLDSVYISSDYGVKKPDKAFFDLMLEKEGLKPEECIMVGNDGVCDIQGAREKGMETLYIHSNISPEETDVNADTILEEMDMGKVKEILLEKLSLA